MGGGARAEAGGGSAVKIRVDCHAGYRGEETPVAIWLGPRRVEVVEVLDRWLAPDHRYFKLRTSDRAVMIVRHDCRCWEWELTFFRQM
jgi:hypothetical protein